MPPLYNNRANANLAFGHLALFENTTGEANTAVGVSALRENTTGHYNIAVGSRADVTLGNLTNATAIGYLARVDASNKVRIGNTAVATIEGQVGWSTASDRRVKKEIEDLSLGLDWIKQLRPREFVRKNDSSEKKNFGFIAQEVAQTFTSEEVNLYYEDTQGYYFLSYNDFIAPIIKAIQELDAKYQREIRRLHTENEILKAEIKELTMAQDNLRR